MKLVLLHFLTINYNNQFTSFSFQYVFGMTEMLPDAELCILHLNKPVQPLLGSKESGILVCTDWLLLVGKQTVCVRV